MVKMIYTYVIESDFSKDRLKSTLVDAYETVTKSDCLENTFFLRVICKQKINNDQKVTMETKRTIVFSRFKFTDDFIVQTQLDIEKYDWSKFKSCDNFSEIQQLHFRGFSRSMRENEVAKHIYKPLDFLFEGERPYKVNIPVRNRDNGYVKGYGSIIFDSSVELSDRNLCKLLLNNMGVSDGRNTRYIACRWHAKNIVVNRKREVVDISEAEKRAFGSSRNRNDFSEFLCLDDDI